MPAINQVVPQSVRQVWNETPMWLRTGTKWAEGIGWSLLVLGVVTDWRQWGPRDWGFSTNIYSSLVAFFIGVPVALIGLDAINESRQKAESIERAKSLRNKSWSAFADSVRKLCTVRNVNTFKILARDYGVGHDLAVDALKTFVQSTQNADDLKTLQLKFEEAALKLEGAMAEYKLRVPSQAGISFMWLSISGKWTDLSTFVKVQMFGLSVDWMDDINDARLRHFVGRSQPGVAVDRHMKAPAKEYDSFFTTAFEEPAVLRKLAGLDPALIPKEFEKKMSQDVSKNLTTAAGKDWKLLQNLADEVDKVEASNFLS